LNSGNPGGGADQACPAHRAEGVDQSRDCKGFACAGGTLQEHQLGTCTIERVDNVVGEASLLGCEGSKGVLPMSITCEVQWDVVVATAEAIAVEQVCYFFVDRFGGVVIIGELPGEQMFKFESIGP
jgi:hypothetical protein